MESHMHYWRYALEIEKAGSIRKAADQLFMGQPNLSRALAELEESLGIRIFQRSSQGVKPTAAGAEFLLKARSVLKHIEDVEKCFRSDENDIQKLQIQVPRGFQTSQAISQLLSELSPTQTVDIQCEESVSTESIKNVIRARVDLAVVRFHEAELSYYNNLFLEHHIAYQPIWSYDYVVTMAKTDPLSEKNKLTVEELQPYREVIHAHRTANVLIPEQDTSEGIQSNYNQKIYVNDRATQMTILKLVPRTYMWGAPCVEKLVQNAGLVQKQVCGLSLYYHEGVIVRNNYTPTFLENRFLDLLYEFAKETSEELKHATT